MSNCSENLFLGRQPILNRQREVIGYEILFRPAADSLGECPSPAAATADVVCNAFAELGLAKALGKQRAFIHIDQVFLANDLILVLPVHTVVLTIQPTGFDEASLSRCRELRAAGYEFALAHVDALDHHTRDYLALSSYVCVDIEADSEINLLSQLANHQQATAMGIQLIATGVNTPKAQARAGLLGFDCFQGYAFAQPVLVSGRKLGSATHNLIRMLNLIRQDAEVGEIESLMKGEPALVANLLRLSNSAAMGLPTRITSIRQAINMLGRQQLQRWLQLLLFAHPKQDTSLRANPLMQLAALRGYFLELLVQRCYPARREMRDPAFLVGLMSVMPAALEIPMDEILEQIVLTDEVREALATRGNPLGQLLDLIESYDNDDVSVAAKKLAQLGARLGVQTLNLCLTEAIAWMLSLDEESAAA